MTLALDLLIFPLFRLSIYACAYHTSLTLWRQGKRSQRFHSWSKKELSGWLGVDAWMSEFPILQINEESPDRSGLKSGWLKSQDFCRYWLKRYSLQNPPHQRRGPSVFLEVFQIKAWSPHLKMVDSLGQIKTLHQHPFRFSKGRHIIWPFLRGMLLAASQQLKGQNTSLSPMGWSPKLMCWASSSHAARAMHKWLVGLTVGLPSHHHPSQQKNVCSNSCQAPSWVKEKRFV